MLTLRVLQSSRLAISSTLPGGRRQYRVFGAAPRKSLRFAVTARRPRDSAAMRRARASARIRRGSQRFPDAGPRGSRRRLNGGFCQGIWMVFVSAPTSLSSTENLGCMHFDAAWFVQVSCTHHRIYSGRDDWRCLCFRALLRRPRLAAQVKCAID
jgi:hypothetical protein